MNLDSLTATTRSFAFEFRRVLRSVRVAQPIQAIGDSDGQIGAIVVINLDRQPLRWRRVSRELNRLRTSGGDSLLAVTQRFPAVDARDGRAAAATADVDPIYRIGDQLHVQPDSRLSACFADNEQIRMTRQEIAVARSHIEVWKTIARGDTRHVLVLEDDAWFKTGAARAIDRGWRAALELQTDGGGPQLLYLSYSDADGTMSSRPAAANLIRPERGLWFLSGYVLSRSGAEALLRSMPVVGPVDLWMNYRLGELAALAVHPPVIMQRADETSDNSYSVLPYLARAGIVDISHGPAAPNKPHVRPVLAWSTPRERESLALALSMLGLRVRAFDPEDHPLDERRLQETLNTFDALVNPPLRPAAADAIHCHLVLEHKVSTPSELLCGRHFGDLYTRLPPNPTWPLLCDLLGVETPTDPYPVGVPGPIRLFRDDRLHYTRTGETHPRRHEHDDTPWTLPASALWQPSGSRSITDRPLTTAAPISPPSTKLNETFPGNLADFHPDRVDRHGQHLRITIAPQDKPTRPYRSGAIATSESFRYGRFEARITAAPGAGLVTGLFLHRTSPRQEIDIEIAGNRPKCLLVNVYFNPGDAGSGYSYGYRGTPHCIELGFDATTQPHHYAIEWTPDRITWLVDHQIVHQRLSWDPTPIPHLPMRFLSNVWAPRSTELAGVIDPETLPSSAEVCDLTVAEWISSSEAY